MLILVANHPAGYYFWARIMKSRLKYLLLFGLFFFKGYNHSLAAMHPSPTNEASVHSDASSDNISFCDWHQTPVYVLLDNLLDDDDDDLTSIKEKISSGNDAFTFADSLFLNDLFFLKNHLQFHKNCGYSFSNRYILLRTLRVWGFIVAFFITVCNDIIQCFNCFITTDVLAVIKLKIIQKPIS